MQRLGLACWSRARADRPLQLSGSRVSALALPELASGAAASLCALCHRASSLFELSRWLANCNRHSFIFISGPNKLDGQRALGCGGRSRGSRRRGGCEEVPFLIRIEISSGAASADS